MVSLPRSEVGPGPTRTLTLQRAVLLLVVAVLLAGALPAWLGVNRLLRAELERRARGELALAPRVFADRNAAVSDALMMSAKEFAGTPAVAAALKRMDNAAARQALAAARGALGDPVLLMDETGRLWADSVPLPGRYPDLLRKTRRGEMPVEVIAAGAAPRMVALAPVQSEGAWLGAAGVLRPLDRETLGTLAGLTRADVVLLGAAGQVAVSTANPAVNTRIAGLGSALPRDGTVRTLGTGEARLLLAATPLGDSATAVFVRGLAPELALLPRLQRVIAVAGALAVVVSVLLGALLAARLARPVHALADAADRLADGDFAAPLRPSRVREVRRLADAFAAMRRALAARLEELQRSNDELADRERRLTMLQAEVVQRERLAASGRMVAELAHEIRNPVASLRNCLEVLLRRLDADRTGQEFANLAIDELLRMHELAERMLDLNRPRDPAVNECNAGVVAREVAALVRAGSPNELCALHVEGDLRARAAVPPDALKQVLLNLVYNAREAVPEGLELEIGIVAHDGRVEIAVADNGAGIPAGILPRLFDPFFTTKSASGGVGLGLSVAEGMVRSYGGQIRAGNRPQGGACFWVDLPAASPETGAKSSTPARGFS